MHYLTKTTTAGLLLAGLLAGPAAIAEPTYPPVAPPASGVPISGGSSGAAVVPAGGETTPSGGLPRTGQDLGLYALAGGVALVAGAGVVLALRRPASQPMAQQRNKTTD